MIAAGLLTLVLESARGTFDLLLSIGAGTGLLYLLRWFWWRINAWSEIAAMASSFVLAVGLLVLERNGVTIPSHLSLIVTVAITTAVWLAATFLTPPTDDATLRRFYRLARPSGPGLDRGAARVWGSGAVRGSARPPSSAGWPVACSSTARSSAWACCSWAARRRRPSPRCCSCSGVVMWRSVSRMWSPMMAVVLARGRGRRMQLPDAGAALTAAQQAAADAGAKVLMPVGEGAARPFLDYALSALADAGCTEGCLVVAPDHAAVRAHYAPARLRALRALRRAGRADAAPPPPWRPPRPSWAHGRSSSSTATTSTRSTRFARWSTSTAAACRRSRARRSCDESGFDVARVARFATVEPRRATAGSAGCARSRRLASSRQRRPTRSSA